MSEKWLLQKSRCERYAVRSDDGAGYGNRTRLHGLGSRCITDIRTLQVNLL